MGDLTTSSSYEPAHPIDLVESIPAKPIFPNLLSEFVYVRTYSRWKDEVQRRETWSETVDRYVTFLEAERTIPRHVLRQAREAILSMGVLPSMRALWSAGDAARRDHTSMYNCLGVETAFVTSNGVRRFSDFRDGDRVEVMTHTGAWKPAVVRSYGEQVLGTVVLRGGTGTVRQVRATRDHAWLLADGSRTRSLKIGDVLVRAPRGLGSWVFDESGPLAQYSWALGYIYGQRTGAEVRLPSGHPHQQRFKTLGFSVSRDGEDIVVRAPHVRGTLPELGSGTALTTLSAFVHGFVDSCCKLDGPVDHLEAEDEETAEFVRTMFPVVGISVGHEFDYEDSDGEVWFPIGNEEFRVEDIQESSVETVWCLEVEDDHSFVLEGGVVTGNCSFVPLDSLRGFAEALYILMCFHPDTQIRTRGGNKRIADITPEDEVGTVDVETGEVSFARPEAILCNPTSEAPKMRLTFDDGSSVLCTEDHLFWTKNRGWVAARDLSEDDDL